MWLSFLAFSVLGVALAFALGSSIHDPRIVDFKAYARRYGLQYEKSADHSFPDRFGEVTRFRRGDQRYLRHRIFGEKDGLEWMTGEYHARVFQGKIEPDRHIYDTLVMCRPDFELPDLLVREESISDRVLAVFGYEDINVESAAFSKRFTVQASSRDGAYQVLQPATIQRMLAVEHPEYEIRHGWLILGSPGKMTVKKLVSLMNLASYVVKHIPDFSELDPPGSIE